MKHIEIAEQRVVGGWLRLLNFFGWNNVFQIVVICSLYPMKEK